MVDPIYYPKTLPYLWNVALPQLFQSAASTVQNVTPPSANSNVLRQRLGVPATAPTPTPTPAPTLSAPPAPAISGALPPQLGAPLPALQAQTAAATENTPPASTNANQKMTTPKPAAPARTAPQTPPPPPTLNAAIPVGGFAALRSTAVTPPPQTIPAYASQFQPEPAYAASPYASQVAAEMAAPKTFGQQLQQPAFLDFIASIGQALAANGVRYGNETPASALFANSARGITQGALANEYERMLAADPNAVPAASLSPEYRQAVQGQAQRKQAMANDKERLLAERESLRLRQLAIQADMDYQNKRLALEERIAQLREQGITDDREIAKATLRLNQRATDAEIKLKEAQAAAAGQRYGNTGLTQYQAVQAATELADVEGIPFDAALAKVRGEAPPAEGVGDTGAVQEGATAAPTKQFISLAQLEALAKRSPENAEALAQLIKKIRDEGRGGVSVASDHALAKLLGGSK